MKKLVLTLFILLTFTINAFATRYIYQEVLQDGKGNVVSGASITVYLAGTTTKATIYTTFTGGSADADSVVTTGSDGTYAFYVDEDDYNND